MPTYLDFVEVLHEELMPFHQGHVHTLARHFITYAQTAQKYNAWLACYGGTPHDYQVRTQSEGALMALAALYGCAALFDHQDAGAPLRLVFPDRQGRAGQGYPVPLSLDDTPHTPKEAYASPVMIGACCPKETLMQVCNQKGPGA